MGYKCSSNYLPILLVDILLSGLHCWRDSIGRASNIFFYEDKLDIEVGKCISILLFISFGDTWSYKYSARTVTIMLILRFVQINDSYYVPN